MIWNRISQEDAARHPHYGFKGWLFVVYVAWAALLINGVIDGFGPQYDIDMTVADRDGYKDILKQAAALIDPQLQTYTELQDYLRAFGAILVSATLFSLKSKHRFAVSLTLVSSGFCLACHFYGYYLGSGVIDNILNVLQDGIRSGAIEKFRFSTKLWFFTLNHELENDKSNWLVTAIMDGYFVAIVVLTLAISIYILFSTRSNVTFLNRVRVN